MLQPIVWLGWLFVEPMKQRTAAISFLHTNVTSTTLGSKRVFFSLRSVELNYKPLPFSYIEFSILSLCTLSNGRYKATLFQCVYSIYPRVNMFCWLNSIQRFQFFVNIHRTSIPTIYTP